MKVLYWIVLGLVALALALFAASNRAPVALGFWPLGLALEMPLYLAILLTFFAGILLRCAGRLGRGPTLATRSAPAATAHHRAQSELEATQARLAGPSLPARSAPSAASDLVPPAIPPYASADPPARVPARG